MYAPITWQVDRTCHLISAASFDEMCRYMKNNADDMTSDLHPHGSRELVAPEWASDTIYRKTSVSSFITHHVRDGEDSNLLELSSGLTVARDKLVPLPYLSSPLAVDND